MIIPKGRVVYENLNTSFTKLSELLSELKSESHTGYVRVCFWDYEAVLYFDGGKIINGIEEKGDERLVGPDAVGGVMEKVQEKNGTISVYHLPAETVTLLASTIRGEALYKDLSTEFTSLLKLIEKLCAEAHTGYIEVNIRELDGAGMIFMQAGDPVTSVFSFDGKTATGPNVLSRIIEVASHHGAIFHVYQAELEAAIADGAEVMAGLELPLLLEMWEDILTTVERAIADVAKLEMFLNTFKDVRVQFAEKYPFLDPFAAQFSYEHGKIQVQGASTRQLNQGLSECLTKTIHMLDEKLPKIDLPERTRDALTFLAESRREELQKFGLPALLPEIFE